MARRFLTWKAHKKQALEDRLVRVQYATCCCGNNDARSGARLVLGETDHVRHLVRESENPRCAHVGACGRWPCGQDKENNVTNQTRELSFLSSLEQQINRFKQVAAEERDTALR